MSRQRLTVVLSQAQGKNPARRALEESIAAALILESGLDVSIVPHLYDLGAEHTGRLFLESIQGDMVVLAWLFPRAAFWLLDRDGIKGRYGENQIAVKDEDDEEEEEKPEPKGIGALDVQERWIYCLDLRAHDDHRVYVDEVKRAAAECQARRESVRPASLVQLGVAGKTNGFTQEQLMAPPGRRWYPVIDYSR